ncbi:HK97 family phage prohead protease [Shewanella frigidimarina]|uniref:HK97 family phage prohead protease n=1 Tax=Shewanella frigidimarina TaxID=56812 RepID=UPI003D7949D8
MKLKRQGVEYEIKSIDEQGYFSGYGNVKYVKDHANDITISGAFTRSMQQHKANGTMPMMFWNHDNQGLQIGQWLDMYEDEHGLVVEGQLFIDDIQLAKEVYFLMKKKLVKALSIGYFVLEQEYNHDVNANILIDVELVEVSPVNMPCNEASLIEVVKSKLTNNETPTERELEKALREIGLSRKQAREFVSTGYKSFTPLDINEQTSLDQQPEADFIEEQQATELAAKEEADLAALNKREEKQKGLNEVLALINKLK